MLIDQLASLARELDVNMYRICEYQNGQYTVRELRPAGMRQNVYSVSKSVTSLLIGILAGQKKLAVSDSVAARMDAPGLPRAWEDITLEALLTHTTGHAKGFLDIDQPDFVLPPEGDFLRAVFAEPLAYRPGEKMVYSDSNYYLAAYLAERAAGMPLQDFARKALFTPMGLYGTAWQTCPQGHCMGATGLILSISDMAKLGVLILQNGQWAGQQLVPAEWLPIAAAPHARPEDPAAFYGYGFWGRKGSDVIVANGMLGQLIAVFPQSGRVIAWQSCTEAPGLGKMTDFVLQEGSKA